MKVRTSWYQDNVPFTRTTTCPQLFKRSCLDFGGLPRQRGVSEEGALPIFYAFWPRRPTWPPCWPPCQPPRQPPRPPPSTIIQAEWSRFWGTSQTGRGLWALPSSTCAPSSTLSSGHLTSCNDQQILLIIKINQTEDWEGSEMDWRAFINQPLPARRFQFHFWLVENVKKLNLDFWLCLRQIKVFWNCLFFCKVLTWLGTICMQSIQGLGWLNCGFVTQNWPSFLKFPKLKQQSTGYHMHARQTRASDFWVFSAAGT